MFFLKQKTITKFNYLFHLKRTNFSSKNLKLNFGLCPFNIKNESLGVKKLMTKINRDSIISLPLSSSHEEAAKKMIKHDIGSMLITDNQKKNVVGLYTETDFTNMVGLKGTSPDNSMKYLTFGPLPIVNESDSYLEAIKCFFKMKKRYALVTKNVEGENCDLKVNKNRKIVGMITPLDVIKGLTDIEMNKSQNVTAKRVLEIMKIQPENEETPMNNMFSIDESKPVLDALRLMIRTHANKFIATKDGKFKGLFTTRQYCRKMGLKRKNPENVKVGDVVETAAVFVKPEDTISKCFKLFMENKLVRNLIVSNSKNAEDILGIISSRDCLRCLYTE